jgi:tetratricopeptide (TPR) repeat protein
VRAPPAFDTGVVEPKDAIDEIGRYAALVADQVARVESGDSTLAVPAMETALSQAIVMNEAGDASGAATVLRTIVENPRVAALLPEGFRSVVWCEIGAALEGAEALAAAADAFHRAEHLAGADAALRGAALHGRAIVAARLGRDRDAMEHAKHAVALLRVAGTDAHTLAVLGLGQLLRNLDAALAAQCFEHVIDRGSGEVKAAALVGRARIRAGSGRRGDAIGDLDRALGALGEAPGTTAELLRAETLLERALLCSDSGLCTRARDDAEDALTRLRALAAAGEVRARLPLAAGVEVATWIASQTTPGTRR